MGGIEQGSKASQRAQKHEQKRHGTAGQSVPSKKHPSPRLNSMAVKDGRLLEGPPGRGRFTAFETPIDKVQRPAKGLKKVRFATPNRHGNAGQIAPSKKHPSPRLNSMAVKDGRLLERLPGRGPFAGFEAPREQVSKASQRAQKRAFCHAETAWHCEADRAFEKAPFATP